MTAYSDRPSPLSSVDPRLKIAYSLVISLLAVMLGKPLFLGGLFAITVLPWILIRPQSRQIKVLAILLGMTVAGTMISQGFFYGLRPRTELLTILPGLSLCREGVVYGAVQSLRLLAVLAAGTIVVSTTHPSDLVLALRKLRVPHSFAFMLTLGLRFLPETVEQARRILLAQRLRGLQGKGLAGALRCFRFLLIPLMGVSLRSARRVALAAEVRAYSGCRSSMNELRFSRADWVIGGGLLLLTCLGVSAVILGYGAAPGGIR
jgi:energy-coupling factor transport system permease protein